MFTFDFKFISADIDLTRSKIFVTVIEPLHGGGGGGGGVVYKSKTVLHTPPPPPPPPPPRLQGNLWYSPPASMTSRLASVTFKMASKVFIAETDKNFDFVTEMLFRFLGL